MAHRSIVPCLWFDAQAERAAAFYAETFTGGRVTAASRYPESAENPAKEPRGSVLTVELEIFDQAFTALNGGPAFTINPSISFFVDVTSAAEVDRLYAALAAGGEALMPIGSYPWGERYAWVKDRFGVSWQLVAGAAPARIAPCLMFAGARSGRAEEAIAMYTRVFPGGRVEQLARYAAGEGPEGRIKHARFGVAGQTLVAMDGDAEHDVAFDEGVSLQVMCESQAEVDRYWAALSEGGEPGPCGWLKDRFGVSWQVVPTGIGRWLTSADAAARDRAFAAFLRMTKPDVAELEAAFRGA